MTSMCEHVHVHVYSRTSNDMGACCLSVCLCGRTLLYAESVSGVRFTKSLGIHWPNNGSGNLHRKVICRYNVCVIHVPYDHQKWQVGTYTEMDAYSDTTVVLEKEAIISTIYSCTYNIRKKQQL